MLTATTVSNQRVTAAASCSRSQQCEEWHSREAPEHPHLLLNGTPKPGGSRALTTRGLSGLVGWSGVPAWPRGSPATHREKAACVSRALVTGTAASGGVQAALLASEPQPVGVVGAPRTLGGRCTRRREPRTYSR
nr:unnamed protein product [Digitaria exilis]